LKPSGPVARQLRLDIAKPKAKPPDLSFWNRMSYGAVSACAGTADKCRCGCDATATAAHSPARGGLT
jgi:hypothetical protein